MFPSLFVLPPAGELEAILSMLFGTPSQSPSNLLPPSLCSRHSSGLFSVTFPFCGSHHQFGFLACSITKLCGAKQLGYFGRCEFYIALKLIAAAQAGLPVQLDSINCELPLPHLMGMKGDTELWSSNPAKSAETQGQLAQFPQCRTALSPRGTDNVLGQQQQSCVQSTDSEPQASPSDYTGDPWRITEEQREYYFNQFKSLQPDMKSLISGSVAKDLFTKSKLPVRELCHIWELSDVDCDGALTLYEFCAAFHLVVARKNGYSLPATLPETLLPEYLQRNEGKSLCNVTTESLPAPQQWRDWNRIENEQRLQSNFTGAQRKSHSSNSADDAIKKGEEPPAPPPRVQKTHSRASSLDLNKLFQQSNQAQKSGALLPPPALPPRPPTLHCWLLLVAEIFIPTIVLFLFFSSKDMLPRQPPLKPLRRKLQPESQVENQEQSSRVSATAPAPETKPQHQLQKMSSNQRRAIQTAVRKNKEANMVLVRLNGELQQQFKVSANQYRPVMLAGMFACLEQDWTRQ
uniref:RALBP1 associated Eps domain containing 2 n=1 Tax=Callorhinchus milii TaxID=7868 RepID=A0A4W3I6X7_CALMI